MALRVAHLTDGQRALLDPARRATLATIAADGRPRLVPICFVVVDDVIWSPLDEKPKSVDDPRRLARVRHIERDARVTLLVDRWSEDWSELGWLRLDGRGDILEPEGDPATTANDREEHAAAVAALRNKYPQYATHDLETRPIIRLTIDRAVGWGDLSTNETARKPIAQPTG